MIALTLSGHIGRQEAVSMLPPMFLDVQKDDIVLDMCAAPGSKTLQILEKLQKQDGHGIVVANDADSKRAYLLVHQVSHLKSSRIIVTTHLGQQYPFLRCLPRGSLTLDSTKNRGNRRARRARAARSTEFCAMCRAAGTGRWYAHLIGRLTPSEKPPICGKSGTSSTRWRCIRCRSRLLSAD